MGEKLLAQRLIRLLRDTQGRSSRTAWTLIDWLVDQGDWLWPDIVFAGAAPPVARGGARLLAAPETDAAAAGSTEAATVEPGETLSWDRLPELAAAIDTDDEPEPALFAGAGAVAELFGFDRFERDVLIYAVALDRMPRLAAFRSRLCGGGVDLPELVGRLAGADPGDAGRHVRRSGPVTLGLLFARSDSHGSGHDLGVQWQLGRALDSGLTDPDSLIDALAGRRQSARLGPADFADQGEALDLMARLFGGALRTGAAGVNLLLYGPPGTGKTELARTLAAAAGAALYAVGEVDPDGEEPSRLDRLSALKRAQRLLGRRPGSLLLFDEMEDLFSRTGMLDSRGEWRSGSKIFVNRLLEANAVPTIWTSNAIDAVDPAHLRRMSFILRMGYPTRPVRSRIVARLAEAEGVAAAGAGLDALLPAEEGATGVARSALKAAALAGGGAADAGAAARALLLGLRGGRPPPPAPAAAADPGLYEADLDVGALVERIAAPDAPADVSLLLTGPPGTGKTALAALVAERLGRPLAVKRASDLLSVWVGGTEANIAGAFAEARERGCVLLFDECDSLLLDRADAHRSWEISQVNELLTWMDSHPLPFIAATNWPWRLDPAALRRFVFKLDLKALSPARAARAWALYFGGAAPAGLAAIAGLTPGDFAVVARQLRFRGEAAPRDILARLEAEARAKPESCGRMGF